MSPRTLAHPGSRGGKLEVADKMPDGWFFAWPAGAVAVVVIVICLRCRSRWRRYLLHGALLAAVWGTMVFDYDEQVMPALAVEDPCAYAGNTWLWPTVLVGFTVLAEAVTEAIRVLRGHGLARTCR